MGELQQQVRDLQAQVRTDALTGLYNYRFFSDTLLLEMERTRRSFQPLSLVLLDLDYFKAFNDRWGHDAGNQALVHLAGVVNQGLRKLDFACRYGGEEFALILPNTDLRHAVSVAERVRELLVSSPLIMPTGETCALTASFGVDEFAGQLNESPEEFTRRVDYWLYQAKLTGRNRVACPVITEPNKEKTKVTQEEKETLFDLFRDTENNSDLSK
ncbi:GGDEF domain-containing protein [Cellvibrio japonicus]|uniref:GGDEF domain-containing protein n=1 Tax=Cellvibrio japonicus TaxID=155077 RepID=UPI000673FBEF|nr:diguanylate cyclase [Cellvibrio japonicus]